MRGLPCSSPVVPRVPAIRVPRAWPRRAGSREMGMDAGRRGDGAIFGHANYKSELSHPRGIVSLPELAREAVETFSISDRQSIVRVKETGECVMVFHYSTRGEDDAYGVYAIDFGRGGERLLFKQGERLNAPRGIAHLSRFPTLTELTLPDADVSTDELQGIASCGRLRMLMLGTPHVNDAVATSLSRMDSLQALRIASARLSVEGIRALASMPRLEALSLRDQDVPPAPSRSFDRLRDSDSWISISRDSIHLS